MKVRNSNYLQQKWSEDFGCSLYVVGCGTKIDVIYGANKTGTVFIHENIKGSDMAVIKGANHGSYISKNGKMAYVIASDWLNSKGI